MMSEVVLVGSSRPSTAVSLEPGPMLKGTGLILSHTAAKSTKKVLSNEPHEQVSSVFECFLAILCERACKKTDY